MMSKVYGESVSVFLFNVLVQTERCVMLLLLLLLGCVDTSINGRDFLAVSQSRSDCRTRVDTHDARSSTEMIE